MFGCCHSIEFNLSYVKATEKFQNVFVRLGESEPRYITYFLEVD
jgi:hypothetical protein